MNMRIYSFLVISSLCFTGACSSGGGESESAETSAEEVLEPVAEEPLPVYGNLLTINTSQMEFNLNEEVPAGLTTIRYENNSTMTHFVVFEKMPVFEGEQITVSNSLEEVAPVFQQGMDLINEGKNDEAMAAFGNLPAWFPEMKFVGGIGLTGPNSVSQSTLILEPGTYVLECYVKSNGIFHSAEGMMANLVVTDTGESASGALPEADVVIDVNEDGYTMTGNPAAGLQTFRVNYNFQKVHENFVQHDVNLVRIEPETNPNEVQVWLNWMTPGAFQTPAPATFVGGMQEMPEGMSGVFTARLEPGEYALVAEIPEPNQKGMFKTFTVTSPDVAGK